VTAWAVGTATALVAGYGRFGFNPTDQGYVLAQAWQIRHGAVPHLEAISSRPFGSEVLHLVDFWLPGPLYLSSMWLSALELVLATVWLAVLVLDRPVRAWRLSHVLLVSAAELVNVHAFPLMAWPTIDGMALAAGGWLAVVRGRQRGSIGLCAAGALACGFAPLTKQSFAAVPVIALVLLGSRLRGRGAAWVWAGLVGPGVAYLAWVGLGGGFSAMTDQLLGGQAVYGRELVSGALHVLRHDRLFAVAAPVLVACLVVLGGARRGALLVAGAAAYAGLVVLVVLRSGLTIGGAWGDVAFWAALGIVVVRAVRARRAPATGAVLVLALGWMVSLSWGYATPDLISGSLLLVVGVESWRACGARLPEPGRVLLGSGLLAATLVASVTAHDVSYRDAPRDALTADAGRFAPGLAGVRTSQSTLRYLLDIKRCVADHPAERVAVLPDNPVVYPLLDLDDPFPQIWVLRLESYGKVPDQLVAAARRLREQGGYLVLFQTFDARRSWLDPPAVPPERLFVPGLQHRISEQLEGEPVRCGSLVGVYRP
jgi:hypothetical protein